MKTLSFASSLALLALSASAGTVSYSTSNSQLCVGASGCGVLTQTIAGVLTVTFTPVVGQNVNANPFAFGNYGTLTISCVGGGTTCADTSLAGLNLYINISQSSPGAGIASLGAGAITGSASGSSSSAVMTWPASSVSIGSIEYAPLNNPLGLVPPSVNGGTSAIQSLVIDNTPVPEPSAGCLASLALSTLALLRYRKTRTGTTGHQG